jgi:hypothetical protein
MREQQLFPGVPDARVAQSVVGLVVERRSLAIPVRGFSGHDRQGIQAEGHLIGPQWSKKYLGATSCIIVETVVEWV